MMKLEQNINNDAKLIYVDTWCQWLSRAIKIQLNPAIAYFKGLVKIMLYTEVFFIANM